VEKTEAEENRKIFMRRREKTHKTEMTLQTE
jgi:hypothetical protein